MIRSWLLGPRQEQATRLLSMRAKGPGVESESKKGPKRKFETAPYRCRTRRAISKRSDGFEALCFGVEALTVPALRPKAVAVFLIRRQNKWEQWKGCRRLRPRVLCYSGFRKISEFGYVSNGFLEGL